MDAIDEAVKATEEPPQVPAQTEALCQVTLTFLADGGIHMAAAGDLRPSECWAFAEFMREVGSDMFSAAKAKARAELEARQSRIVVPMGQMRPVR